jgi:STE24 endopeptidase
MSITSMIAAAVTAAPFDPEAATRAYLDTLQGAARARSDAYFEGGYWLSLWASLVAILGYWIMLRTGWSAAWGRLAEKIAWWRWLKPVFYAIPFTIVGALLVLPWTLYEDYFREHQYGMSNQTLAEWFKEWAIMLGVGTVIGMISFGIIYAVIRNSPKRWWLWGTGAIVALMSVMILVQPVFIAPLINKYTPMKPGPVREEILRIAHEQDIPANDVYVVDASKQTKRISANVAGLGPTIRIALNDNLLNRSNIHGIKAVMGHEMGHYKLYHIQKLLAYLALMTLVGLFILSRTMPALLRRHSEQWKVSDVSDPASAPLFYAILAVLLVPGEIAFNSVIRHHESEADAFGLEAAREPDGFAMTAMQLSEYRKIEPAAWEEVLFYDHPSGRTRVRMAMDWKARNLDKLPPEQRAPMVMTSGAKD